MLEKYLCDIDFVDIKFIDWELKYTTRDEFILNAKTIKKVYKAMDYRQKQIYKWYCYANIHTNLYQKNKIWDYLNGSIGYKECITSLEWDGSNYKSKCED